MLTLIHINFPHWSHSYCILYWYAFTFSDILAAGGAGSELRKLLRKFMNATEKPVLVETLRALWMATSASELICCIRDGLWPMRWTWTKRASTRSPSDQWENLLEKIVLNAPSAENLTATRPTMYVTSEQSMPKGQGQKRTSSPRGLGGPGSEIKI